MQRLNIIKNIILRSSDLDRDSLRVGNEIWRFYKGKYGEDVQIVVLVILEGAVKFARHTFSKRHLGCLPNFKLHNIKVNSYKDAIVSSGEVSLDIEVINEIKQLYKDIKESHILIVDDIYDTGITLNALINVVKDLSPASIECCVMLEREVEHTYNINPKFVGHKITTKDFLVGGGLDFKGKLRDLPYIGALNMKEISHDKETGEVYKICKCNQCGEECISERAKEDEKKESFYGLINAEAKGYYFSPVLDDCTAYRFDLCEKCLKKMFDNFKIPVDLLEYDPWDGRVEE